MKTDSRVSKQVSYLFSVCGDYVCICVHNDCVDVCMDIGVNICKVHMNVNLNLCAMLVKWWMGGWADVAEKVGVDLTIMVGMDDSVSMDVSAYACTYT